MPTRGGTAGTRSVAEGLGFLGASASIRLGGIAAAEIAPTFLAPSAASTFGLTGTSGTSEHAVSLPLDRSMSVTTLG
jgi:hypothetical protein